MKTLALIIGLICSMILILQDSMALTILGGISALIITLLMKLTGKNKIRTVKIYNLNKYVR